MVKLTKEQKQKLANSARDRRCMRRCIQRNYDLSAETKPNQTYTRADSNNSPSTRHQSNGLDSGLMNQLIMKRNIDRLSSSLSMPMHSDSKRKQRRYSYTKQGNTGNNNASVAVSNLSMIPFVSYKRHVLWLSASQQDIANYSSAALSRELEYFAEYVKVTNYLSIQLPI